MVRQASLHYFSDAGHGEQVRGSSCALITLGLLAPLASAHVGPYSDAQTLNTERYYVFISPTPSPMFAGVNITWTANFQAMRSDYPPLNVTSSIKFNDTEGWNAEVNLVPIDAYYVAGNLTMPHAGNFTATLRAVDKTGEVNNSTMFHVFPNLPFRIVASDPALDVRTNRTTTLRVVTTDTAGSPMRVPFNDLRARIEHWDVAHTTVLGVQNVTLARANETDWTVDARFADPGMYHFRFASNESGFGPDDMPMIHMYANPPDAPAARTPGFGAVIVIGIVALGAAMTRRRR